MYKLTKEYLAAQLAPMLVIINNYNNSIETDYLKINAMKKELKSLQKYCSHKEKARIGVMDSMNEIIDSAYYWGIDYKELKDLAEKIIEEKQKDLAELKSRD
jgi:F0F1-type ATP synthase membrane subunit b/b'